MRATFTPLALALAMACADDPARPTPDPAGSTFDLLTIDGASPPAPVEVQSRAQWTTAFAHDARIAFDRGGGYVFTVELADAADAQPSPSAFTGSYVPGDAGALDLGSAGTALLDRGRLEVRTSDHFPFGRAHTWVFAVQER